MLQAMRNNLKGAIAFFIVLFLAFIMAASLVNLTNDPNANQYDEVAKVNDRSITDRELRLGILQEQQRLESQFGQSLPAEFLSEDRLRGPVLQRLINSNVLIDKAAQGNMSISDTELDNMLLNAPTFQQDGEFSSELFVQYVRRLGLTPATYRVELRENLLEALLRNTFYTTAFVTPSDLEKTVALSRQERDFDWVSLPLGDLPSQMVVSEEDISAYYEENKSTYLTSEQVNVEFIELNVDDFLSEVIVDEVELQQQYDNEIAQIQIQTEREAAHILIEESDADKVSEVQTKLAAGEDFGELAETYSDDFGSRTNGGVLGFTSGDVFPAAFEETLATLAPGEVSEPIEIDGATHFIKLVSVKDTEIPSFEESRSRIETELKTLQAEELYIDKLTLLKDLAYNADSLNEVAETMNVTASTTGLFSRTDRPSPVFNDGRVVDAAFSEQVVQEGFTSDVLELSPKQAVVVNLVEHKPVRTLTLDEKRADILSELQVDKAEAQLLAQLEEQVQALKGGKALLDLAAENNWLVNTEEGVDRDTGSLDSSLRDHVFSMVRPSNDPIVSTTTLSNGDLALVVLSKVEDGDFSNLTEEEQRNIRLSLAQSASTSEYQAWEQALVSQAEISIQ